MDKIKIAELQLQNIKRVRAVDITPSDGLTVIGGGNAQGKTSVLDAICYALGGEKYRPSEPQNRDGVAPAKMEITLSNGLVVTRSGKNLDLKVTDPSGKKAGQTLLNSFISQFALDLPKFLNASNKEKAKTLLDTLGIEAELTALDNEERRRTDERLLAGREAERKRHYADELPEYPDAPDAPLSGAEMTKRLQAALAVNAANQAARCRLAELARRVKSAEEELTRAEEAAEAARKAADSAAVRVAQAQADLDKANQAGVGADVDTSAINAELESIDAINAQVRTNQDKAKAKDEAEQAEAEYAAAGRAVEDVRNRRMALLNSVKMPLPGLTVEAGELVYNGARWDCMSSMERIIVGVSIVRQLQPKCGFVLLDQLECFDRAQLAKLRDWLAENNMQAIATRVADDDTCDIIIEDGMVRGQEDNNPPSPVVRFDNSVPEDDLEQF